MLHYMLISDPTIVLMEMDRESKTQFYLTGSRYFRGKDAPADADWDFFSERSLVTEHFLLNLGFRVYNPLLEGLDYSNDPNIAVVYRNSLVTPHIDVQLVDDLRLKLRVQNTLAQLGVLEGEVSKDTAKGYWKTLFTELKYGGVFL